MKKIIIPILCVLIIAFIVYLVHRQHKIAKVVARESSQRQIFVESTFLLEDYYKANGKYPDDLSELPLTYSDGGDISLLKDFNYITDGSSYRLKTIGYHSKEELITEKKPQQIPSANGQTASDWPICDLRKSYRSRGRSYFNVPQ